MPGAGLISRAHYAEFVLPYERAVIRGIKARCDLPIYTHTCGAIGDRLDLMEATGTNGIDTLDPPPLGTVDLAEAKRATAGRLFIKGNIDPVNTMLRGTRADALAAARERVLTARPWRRLHPQHGLFHRARGAAREHPRAGRGGRGVRPVSHRGRAGVSPRGARLDAAGRVTAAGADLLRAQVGLMPHARTGRAYNARR